MNPIDVAQSWNREHPIGTAVQVRRDNGEIMTTTTRGAASVVGPSAVVWLRGISGCYLLDRVSALDDGVRR